jgi:hypothetical protein
MVLRWLINGHRGSALQLNLLQHLKHLPHYMCCSHRNPKLFIVTDNHLELRTLFFQNVLTRHLEPDQTSTLRTRGSICEAFLWHQVLVVSTRKGTDICEFAQPGSYTKVSMTWYMHACEYMYSTYTKRFKVWALARAQTHVSLHNTGSSHKSIYDLWSHICKFVNLCVRIQRGSKCEHPPGDKQYYANLHNLGSYTKVSIIWCI